MKIGVRAHDYGKMEIEKAAETLHRAGYEAAQLALPKVFTGIDSYEDITGAHLERIRRAFEEWKVEIPVFGCYMDLGNPDEEIRSYAVNTLKKCLAYSREVGAKVVGTETAYPHLSREEKAKWYPCMLDSVKRVMEEAVRLDVKLAVEPVYWHPLENLEAVKDVLEQVNDKEHLRLIFDASNLLQYPDTTDQDAYWREWLDGIGEFVEAMHIKDFYLDESGKYCAAPLGKGVIRYKAVSEWLHENRPDMYLLREEMNPAIAMEDIEFMKNL
ncbi:MAG: sugar phosphate isomerase/epimerase [Blautia sp.]|nr:sugar phosphate isomerase/epimerase [Blautia sp.]MCM1200200.1 sugar phosphate isomerase/epimerase [Bacteroides fragilis]